MLFAFFFFLAVYGLSDSLAPKGVVFWKINFLMVYLGLSLFVAVMLLKKKTPLNFRLNFTYQLGLFY